MTLVIVGTGTDVGKTVVAATLLARYGAEIPLAYWKPVATGSRDGRDTATVEALAGDCAAILPETYLFTEPLSPHLAARLDGRRIEPALLLADFDRHRTATPDRTLVIETAGGLLVPLTGGGHDVEDAEPQHQGTAAPPGDGRETVARGEGGQPGVAGAPEADRGLGGGWPFRLPPAGSAASRQPERPSDGGSAQATAAAASPLAAVADIYTQADLLVDMARHAPLACLVVGRSGLGTINHTLLTLEALRARGLPVAAVVLDGPPNRENRLAIQRFGGMDTVLELPHLVPLDREEVAAATRHFDRQGHLAPLLRPRRDPSGPDPRRHPFRAGDRPGSARGTRRGLRRKPGP